MGIGSGTIRLVVIILILYILYRWYKARQRA